MGKRPRRKIGGPDGGRTRDLVNAIHARSQLRHWPMLILSKSNYSSILVLVRPGDQRGPSASLKERPNIRS